MSIEVPYIPEGFHSNRGDGSVHASTIFRDEDLWNWFSNALVSPQLWEIPHPYDIPMDASRRFQDYIPSITELGYRVWNIEHTTSANVKVELKSRTDGRKEVLCGRADYLISEGNTTSATRLNEVKCVVEIQSSSNVLHCEHQLLTYLFLMMNSEGLQNIIGILVKTDDGNCRAFKAVWQPDGDAIYHSDDYFHICHITEVFQDIINSL